MNPIMDNLHTYSSSSSDADEQIENTQLTDLEITHPAATGPPTTRTRGVPPPDELEAANVYASSRSPKRSESRPVSLPHVTTLQKKVDQYLVHVYLPIDHPCLLSFARGLLARARLAMVGKPIKAALTTLTDFHISVSRPATIQSAQIPSLVKQLRKAICQCPRGQAEIRNKPVAFFSKNQRKLFLAGSVATEGSKRDDFTLNLIRIVSKIFERNGLPRFFDDARPHMSFAWTEAVDVSSAFEESDIDDKNEDSLTVHLEEVCCTIGKSKYCFPLK